MILFCPSQQIKKKKKTKPRATQSQSQACLPTNKWYLLSKTPKRRSQVRGGLKEIKAIKQQRGGAKKKKIDTEAQ
jgi:hypothetical protein